MTTHASTTTGGTRRHGEGEHGLLRCEERHRRASADLTGQFPWVTDTDGEAEEEVRFWRRYTGQRYKEARRWGWLNCVHPDDAERVRDTWTKALMTKTAAEAEFRVRRHDGVYRYFLGLAIPLFGDDGAARQWVGTCVDVTEPRQEELANRAAELEAVFAAAHDAVLVYDTDMNVRRANPAFVEVYGFDPVGLNIKDIVPRVSCRWLDGRPFVWKDQPTPRGLGKKNVTGARLLITRADGTEIAVEASTGPMLVGDRITGFVTVWRDVTERERAEDALLRVRTELKHRMQEMAEVVGKVLDDQEKALVKSDARSLTNREREVLALIAEGKSSQAIADLLSLSIHTVNRHRANIIGKLKTNKTADLVAYALSHGLVRFR